MPYANISVHELGDQRHMPGKYESRLILKGNLETLREEWDWSKVTGGRLLLADEDIPAAEKPMYVEDFVTNFKRGDYKGKVWVIAGRHSTIIAQEMALETDIDYTRNYTVYLASSFTDTAEIVTLGAGDNMKDETLNSKVRFDDHASMVIACSCSYSSPCWHG